MLFFFKKKKKKNTLLCCLLDYDVDKTVTDTHVYMLKCLIKHFFRLFDIETSNERVNLGFINLVGIYFKYRIYLSSKFFKISTMLPLMDMSYFYINAI